MQFPFFETNPGIVYLDSAATTLKPYCVIEAMDKYQRTSGLTVHRSVYPDATDALESVRQKVSEVLGSDPSFETIFTSGATDSMNIIAAGLGRKPTLVLITPYSHNSTSSPWLTRYIVRDLSGKSIDFPCHVVITDVENTAGRVAPMREIYEQAKAKGYTVVLDATQSIAHKIPKYYDLVIFSAHKMYGPTGVGVIHGNIDLLRPTRYGSNAIRSFKDAERSGYREPIWEQGVERFEPGTPNIVGIIGFGAALDFLPQAHAQEPYLHRIMNYLKGELLDMNKKDEGIQVNGVIMSLTVKSPFAFAEHLASKGIYVRAGRHCANWTNQGETVRISLGCYNDFQDMEALIKTIRGIH